MKAIRFNHEEQRERSETDKFDLQQYIKRCYGLLTTSDILFKNKDDQFRTGAWGSTVGTPNV